MKNECRFCKIARGERGEYGMVDSPFLDGKDYFSIVSIGAFIDNWTMIVSKEHIYNLHKNYGLNNFAEYLRNHVKFLEKKCGILKRIIVFEHGANKCDSLIACGTSHAHLHVIPFEDGILDEIQKEAEWVKVELSQVEMLVGDKEYFLYGEIDDVQNEIYVYVHLVDLPESQFFRRVLSEKVGLTGNYSYKEDERQEESTKIRKKFEDD